MHFDIEGRLLVSPAEVQQLAFTDLRGLINNVLLEGTPLAFPTHAASRRFLAYFADRLDVHPRNVVIRGSCKLGFSIAPRPEKVWLETGPHSDLDVGIVDSDYFSMLDREIRRWEREDENQQAMRQNSHLHRLRLKRQDSRRFHFYRYFDLPDLKLVRVHGELIRKAPAQACCGSPRVVTAFFYRDWWSVYSRYEYDLRELCQKLARGELPPGEDRPRARLAPADPE
jgi:hypothetical protein